MARERPPRRSSAVSLTTKVIRGENAERLLILMHGIGSNEQDLPGLAPYIDPDGGYVIVSPRAPYAYGPGFAWFKFETPETIASSLDAVEDVIESACAQYDMKREEMVVGGFSQGGAMSLVHAFRAAAKRPRGVLVMSGFLPPLTNVELDWSGELPPVLMQHGTNDPVVPLERAKATATELLSHDVPLQFRTYPMEHSVSQESANDARDWLAQVRKGERPQALQVEVSAPSVPDEPEGAVRSVNSATFDAEVLRSDKPVIVDFWAPWCGPCRAVAPVIEQIAAMRKGSYKVVKCNIDESPDIQQRYNIQSIPLVGLFRGGRMERSSLGAKPRPQLEAELGMLVIP
jgi:thioredoxin 1